LQFSVGLGELFSIEHGLSASPDQLGAVCAEIGCEFIELLNEIVIELNEYLTSSHVHRVNHMVGV
jgi:hypothetical protein